MKHEERIPNQEMGAGFPTMAPVERIPLPELELNIGIINSSPVVSGLLDTVGGLLAVLDETWQVMAVNEGFLNALGLDDPHGALGLRPGEVLKCAHAEATETGCGTTPYCSTCGAAIAIVASLSRNQAVERLCSLRSRRDGEIVDLTLAVRSHPMLIENKRYLLLFLQDITREQKRAALERTFFHDIKNLTTSLLGASELMVCGGNDEKLARTIHRSTMRLIKEIEIQQCLIESTSSGYKPLWQDVPIQQVFTELGEFFQGLAATSERTVQYPTELPGVILRTDLSLLLRVLCNMVLNALEATPEKGTVRIWVENDVDSLQFNIWNEGQIAEESQRRLFERNYSTKEGSGRGIGTYSMKLFGEEILGGRVSYTTSAQDGTVFSFHMSL